MTFADPAVLSAPAFLPAEATEFPQVLALPERSLVPEGELYSFRFANGYGALVIRPLELAPTHGAEPTFELCVLDCAGPIPQPTFQTPVADRVQAGLCREEVAGLLTRAERLPRHPDLLRADEAFWHEEF